MKQVLKSLLEYVWFCAKHSISFRGHRLAMELDNDGYVTDMASSGTVV